MTGELSEMEIEENRTYTFYLTWKQARDLKFEMREIRIKVGKEEQFLKDCPVFNEIHGLLEERV